MKKNSRIIVAIMIVVTMILVLTSCVSQKKPNQAPSAVVNIYPSQSELVDENYFYSKWTASTDPEGGAVTYRINYAQTIEGLDDPTFYETVETYFLLPNLEEGIWYWRVTAMDKNGNSTRSPIWTFTVNGETLPQPVDPEEIPTDPSLIVSGVENTSFTLDWPEYEDRQNPGKAVEYIIYVYDQGQGMSTRNVEEMGYWMSRIAPATTAHTTDTTYTFNNMNSETLYDWVIVAQNNASQTSVVGSSQVRTGNRAPSQPELLNPTEGATDVATDVTLRWSESVDPDGDAVKYYVYIDMVKNTNRNVTVEGIDETEYQPEGLEEGRTYYWFIMAKDANGAATRTQTNTFMTKAEGMDVPNSPTPGDGTEGMDATAPPLLEWEHDKNGAPITYTVYMSANPKKIDKKAEGLTAKNYQIPGLLEGNTRYYWAIEAKDTGTDKTTRSGVWTFKTGTIEAPEQTEAITNSDGTQIELTYDKAMGDPEGKKDTYTVKKESSNTITSRGARTVTTYRTIATSKIERKAGTTNIYILTLEEAIKNGDKVFIDYTPGTVASTDGGKLAKYENNPVTNRVPGALPVCTAATMTADGRNVELSFSQEMKAPTAEEANQFGILVNGYVNEIEGATLSADKRVITLELEKPVGKNNEVHVSYTKGTVASTGGTLLESFQNKKVNTDTLEYIWVNKSVNWNYKSIRAAIDGAIDGDIIIVAPGTYIESFGFDGKAITLKSTYETDTMATATTIIDAQQQGPIMIFRSGEDRNTVFEGFTVMNGHEETYETTDRRVSPYGGAITITGASPTIRNNIFKANSSYNGGAINVSAGNPLIYNNTFDSNEAVYGGAIFLKAENYYTEGRNTAEKETATIYGNTIKNNTADKGAGIYIDDESYKVYNAAGTTWKTFNAPNAAITFVENATEKNNTYSGNTRQERSESRTETLEGIDIYYYCEEELETPAGTLTLRPQTAYEQSVVSLNLDYTIGSEYHNGFVEFILTDTNGDCFEITEGASVIINGQTTPITDSDYYYTAKNAIITGLKLEEGTVTLRLTPQETPAGTTTNLINARDINYEISAKGDADGLDHVWTDSTTSTQNFLSNALSIVTDIAYKEGNELYVKLESTPKSLIVASETTVNVVLSSIKATDDSSQTYEIITAAGTQTGTDELTEAATLIVTAEHGNKAAYAITINPTRFVRLETNTNTSGSRLISRTNPQVTLTSWHGRITDAVDQAGETNQSTITVWPGTYMENVDLGSKGIHLMSTEPASKTVRETTIIDANYEGSGVSVYQNTGAVIIEGFTITHAGYAHPTSSRGDSPAGISVNRGSAIIRNNILTANGNETENSGAPGISVVLSETTINNNTITNNYNVDEGAGIHLVIGTSTVYANSFTGNKSEGNGGAIVIGEETRYSMARDAENDTKVTVYGNSFTNNVGDKGGAIAVYEDATPYNKAGEAWRAFNMPGATTTFVEHNADTEDNNTYSGNSLNEDFSSSRDGVEESTDIWFAGEIKSTAGTLDLSPATVTGDAGEQITLTATYTLDFPACNGAVGFAVPEPFKLTQDASITVGGKTVETDRVFFLDAKTVAIVGINCTDTQTVALAFNYTPATQMDEDDYVVGTRINVDGTGTRYTESDFTYATMTIPPQYAAPEVAVKTPVGIELEATTTVTFTWEATAGTQTNAIAREEAGIAGYVVAFADRDGNWASATVNDGNTKSYATDTLVYGQDYSWHVKAIGANGKTATTTPDATFITAYRLRDLGSEGVAYTLEDDTNFDCYEIAFDSKDLPGRFDGMTEFQINVKGQTYKFGQNESNPTQYNVQIPHSVGTPDDPTMDEVRDGFFGESKIKNVSFAQGETTAEYDTIAEAVAAVDDAEGQATITLKEPEYIFTERINLYSAAPITIMAAEGVTPVINGNDTTQLFYNFTQDSATVTFIGITFSHAKSGVAGAAVISNASMKFVDCTFSNNLASNHAGALYLNWGSFVIKNCQFNDNSCGSSSWGGALNCADNAISLSIIESTFTANNAYRGGALYIGNADTVEIKDSYFDSNTVTGNGGALYLEQSENTDVTISGTTFTSNTATNTNNDGPTITVGYGGALYLNLNTAIEITSATIIDNAAGKSGGGIYILRQDGFTGAPKTSGNSWWYNSVGVPSSLYSQDSDFSIDKNGQRIYPCRESDPVVVKLNTAPSYRSYCIN